MPGWASCAFIEIFFEGMVFVVNYKQYAGQWIVETPDGKILTEDDFDVFDPPEGILLKVDGNGTPWADENPWDDLSEDEILSYQVWAELDKKYNDGLHGYCPAERATVALTRSGCRDCGFCYRGNTEYWG